MVLSYIVCILSPSAWQVSTAVLSITAKAKKKEKEKKEKEEEKMEVVSGKAQLSKTPFLPSLPIILSYLFFDPSFEKESKLTTHLLCQVIYFIGFIYSERLGWSSEFNVLEQRDPELSHFVGGLSA